MSAAILGRFFLLLLFISVGVFVGVTILAFILRFFFKYDLIYKIFKVRFMMVKKGNEVYERIKRETEAGRKKKKK